MRRVLRALAGLGLIIATTVGIGVPASAAPPGCPPGFLEWMSAEDPDAPPQEIPSPLGCMVLWQENDQRIVYLFLEDESAIPAIEAAALAAGYLPMDVPEDNIEGITAAWESPADVAEQGVGDGDSAIVVFGAQGSSGEFDEFFGGEVTAVMELNGSILAGITVSGGLGFDTPSVLSGLTTVDEALRPANIGYAAAGTVVLGVLLTFPSRLLSSAKDRLVERVAPRARARWERFRVESLKRTPKAAVKALPPKRLAGWPLAVAALLVASILTAFIDPRVGFDLGSLRLIGSVFVAFLLDVGIGWVLLILLVSRLVPEAVPRFEFKPWSLLVVVGAVVFTRVAQFEPGLTVGLVAGVVFGGALAGAARARLTLTVLGYAFALAMVAWVAYSLISMSGIAAGEGWLVFVQETLAAITVAGIVALPVSLLPVRGLAGAEILSWSKVAWVIAYALGLAGFLLIVVPLPSSWDTVPISSIAWAALFLAYLIVAIVVWLIVQRPWVPESAEDVERRSTAEVSPPQR